MSGSSAAEKLSVFAETARVFSYPDDETRLTGRLSNMLGTHEQRQSAFESFASHPPERTEVVDVAEVGDLAIAKLQVTHAGGDRSLLLAGFRVANCKIVDLWHIARSRTDQDAAAHKAVIDRLVATNNVGDLDGFLELFVPGLLFYRNSGDPHTLGDKPSKWNGNPEGRRDAFAAMFANGAPGQATADPVFSVGDLVVSRDTIAHPDGKILDEISIYRISDGKITHDWLIALEERGRGN